MTVVEAFLARIRVQNYLPMARGKLFQFNNDSPSGAIR